MRYNFEFEWLEEYSSDFFSLSRLSSALGAHAVGIGRPWAWGLAVNGEQGVSDVFKGLMADLELNAALAGCKNIHEIGRYTIVRNSEVSKL